MQPFQKLSQLKSNSGGHFLFPSESGENIKPSETSDTQREKLIIPSNPTLPMKHFKTTHRNK